MSIVSRMGIKRERQLSPSRDSASHPLSSSVLEKSFSDILDLTNVEGFAALDQYVADLKAQHALESTRKRQNTKFSRFRAEESSRGDDS